MHQAVERPCRLLNLFPHLIVTVHVENVSHKVKSVLIVRNICVESSQVEAVREIVFVDITEVFVSPRRNEL